MYIYTRVCVHLTAQTECSVLVLKKPKRRPGLLVHWGTAFPPQTAAVTERVRVPQARGQQGQLTDTGGCTRLRVPVGSPADLAARPTGIRSISSESCRPLLPSRYQVFFIF